jgi:hypothetical protein
MGIITLLFVVVSVLFGIAMFFLYLLRRAARLTAQQNAALSSEPDPTAGRRRSEEANLDDDRLNHPVRLLTSAATNIS